MDKSQSARERVVALVKGSAILVLSNVFIKAINFFLLPLYTKHLTPSMLGVSDSITTLKSFLLPLLTLGMDSAYSAFYFEKEDTERGRKVYGTLTAFFFLTGFIPLLATLGSGQISDLMFHSSQYKTGVFLSLVTVTLNLWYLPFSLEMRLKNQMGRFGAIGVTASLSMVLLNILFVSYLHLGEMALILSSGIVAMEQLALYSLLIGHWPIRRSFDFDLLKKMFVFAIPLVPSVVMMWVLSTSDRYVLLYYHGEAAVGMYGIGFRFTTLLNVVINAFSTAYTTFAFGSKDDENAKRNYYMIFNVISLALFVISFTAALFSKEIMTLMTEKSYTDSYKTLRDLMFGQSLYAMTSIVSYGIFFEKKSVYSLVAVMAGAAVNLGLNLIFIPKHGIYAAASTTLIGYLVSFLISYYFSEKLYPCFYGLKKVMITFVVVYAISFFAEEATLSLKMVIWTVTVAVLVFLYRKIAGTLLEFAKSLIHRN